MKKLFQNAILSLFCLSAHVNIAKSELLRQVQDLAVTTKPLNIDETLIDPKNPLLVRELSPEEYDRLAFEMCRDHGSEQNEVSEAVYHTLKDTSIIPITSRFFQPFSHSTFTKAATVKQLAQTHPTKQAATESLETNKTIVEKFNQPTIHNGLRETLENIQHHEKAVLDMFLPQTDEQIAAEQAINKRLYPFWNFTKNQATVGLYNRSWQAINAGSFATWELLKSFAHYGSSLTSQAAQEAANECSFTEETNPFEKMQKIMEMKHKFENNPDLFPKCKKVVDLGKQFSTIGEKIDEYVNQNGYTLDSDPIKFPPVTRPIKKTAEGGYDFGDAADYLTHATNWDGDDLTVTLPAKKPNFAFFRNMIQIAAINSAKIITPPAAKNLPAYYIDSLKSATSLLNPYTYRNIYQLVKEKKSTAERAKSVGQIMSSAVTLMSAYSAYRIYATNKELLDTVHEKQIQLIHMNRYLNILRTAGKIIQNDPELQAAFKKELQQINELFNHSSTSISKELRSLINSLMSSSFSGAPSYLFSQIGKVVTTFDALEAHKNLLVPYFEILGKIDAHFAAASLYHANKQGDNRVSICLPTVQDQSAPYINAQGCWHPMIKQSVVVPNNVFMGTNGYAQNLIITGPNAGGKTTTITAVTINIYLSQCFGIACADSFSITPFSHIISALDVTTDLSKDQSLFKAEAARAGMIKDHAVKSNENCLVFSAIDEPFNGTRPDIASNIGYKYLDSLGNCQFHMAIITTHFPELTKLEKNTGRFTNMKVDDATVHADTTITYPFTISRGISTQNIAEAILVTENVL